MTDLPTRLRTTADLYDHRTAGLMRDAADEIERLRTGIKKERDDTMYMVTTVRSPEAAACLECVVDCLTELYHSRPASSPIVKTEA